MKHLPRALLLALALLVASPRPSPAYLYPPEAYGAGCPDQMTDERVDQIIVGRLNRHCQPSGPVGVVREDAADLDARAGMHVLAYTEKCGPGWLIHLSNDVHGELRASVLEHEWAHALAWDEELSHGPLWGVALSATFRGGHLDLDTPPALVFPIQPPPAPTQDQ
jgi:hypothetical protein